MYKTKLEKEMATHYSILAWRIPWIEEPGRLLVYGVARIGHDLVTKPPHKRKYHTELTSLLLNHSVHVGESIIFTFHKHDGAQTSLNLIFMLWTYLCTK